MAGRACVVLVAAAALAVLGLVEAFAPPPPRGLLLRHDPVGAKVRKGIRSPSATHSQFQTCLLTHHNVPMARSLFFLLFSPLNPGRLVWAHGARR